MKFEEIKNIIEILKDNNSKNYYINNNGLSQLGAAIFYPGDKGTEKQRKILTLLQENFEPDEYKNIITSLRKFHWTSYYTDKKIIQFQIDILKKSKIEPKTILEPSAGNGAYVQELKKAFPQAKIIALEPDILSYKILAANNFKSKNVTCINSTFEDYYIDNIDKSKFDLVISNIPFGDFKLSNLYKHDYLIDNNEKNINVYFNKYANEFLSNNGFSFILTSKNFLDKENYKHIRESIVTRSDLIKAFRFNDELFINEKTKVVTDLIIYQKKEKKKYTDITNNEKLFINTNSLKINDNNFHINQFFDEKRHLINGELSTVIFHQKPDLGVKPNNVTLDQFLELGLYETNLTLAKAYQNKKQIDIEENKTIIVPIVETKKENSIEINETIKNKSKDKIEKIIELSDKNYLQNHTRLYSGSYNYINSKLYYIVSDISKFEIKDKKNINLLNSYIPLRNEFVLFKDNIINNRFNNAEEIKMKYDNISYMLDTFHFQYGYLKEFQNSLNTDFYYNEIQNTLEKTQINSKEKYIKNENFNLNFFLEYNQINAPTKNKDEKIKIDKEETKILDNLFQENKINTPVFSKENELKKTIYDYYDFYGIIDLNYISKLYNQDESKLLEIGLESKIFYLNPIFNNNDKFTNYQVDLFFMVESGHIQNKINAFKNNPNPYEINTDKICTYLESIKNEKLDINAIEFNYESFFIPIEAKKEFFKELVDENIEPIFGQFEQNINLVFKSEYNAKADEMYSIKRDLNEENSKENKIKAEYNYKKLFQNFVENVYPVVYYTVEVGENKIRKIDPNATVIAQNKYEQLLLEFKSFIINNDKYKAITEDNFYNYFLAEKEIQINENILQYPKTLIHKPYEHQLSSVLYSLNRGTALMDHKVGHGKSVSMGLLADKLLQHKKAKRVLLTTLKAVSEQLFKEIQMNFPHINMFLLTDKNFNAKKRNETLAMIKNSNIQLIIAEHTHLKKIPKSKKYIETIYYDYLEMIENDLKQAIKFGTKETKKIIKGLEKRKENLNEKLQYILQKLNNNKDNVNLEDLKIEALLIDEAHEYKNIQYTTRHQNVAGLNSSTESDKNFDLEVSIYSIHQRVSEDKNIFFYSGTPIKNSVTELYAYQRYLTPNELRKKKIYNFDSWASIFLKQSVQAESDIFGQARMHKRWRYFTNMPELAKMYRSFTHISDENTFKTNNVNIKSEFKILEPTPGYDDLKTASIDFAKNKNQDLLFGYNKYEENSLKSSYVTALGINRRCLVDPLLEKDLAINFDEEDQIKIKAACQDIYNLYEMSNEHKGVILVFSDIGVYKKDKYNTYETIKNILIEKYKINPSEIGIAQEYVNNYSEFQRKIREGEIRIPIGSTKGLGTGSNVQDRVIGVVELDIPYSPDGTKQRLGRMARAGNWICEKYNNVGYNFSYGIKDSTDIFSYSLNKHKSIFIDQIKQVNHKNRIFDDVLTDPSNMSYAQKEAMLIGDINSFKLVKLEDDLKALKSQKIMFDIAKNNSVKKIEKFTEINKELVTDINYLRKVEKELIQHVPIITEDEELSITKENTKNALNKLFFPLNQTEKFTSFDQANNYLLKKIDPLYLKENTEGAMVVKNLNLENYNVNLIFASTKKMSNNIYCFNLELNNNDKKIIIPGSIQYKFDKEKIAYQLFKLIKSISKTLNRNEFDLNHNLRTIESNIKNSKNKFPEEKEKEIKKFEKEVKELKKKTINKLN